MNHVQKYAICIMFVGGIYSRNLSGWAHPALHSFHFMKAWLIIIDIRIENIPCEIAGRYSV